MIDKTALIHPTAKIAADVSIGPYSIIGENVEIGKNTWIGSHVVIQGPTKIGRDNKIFQFAAIGEGPQDLKYQGEKTILEIGDENKIREFCTIHRGTIQDNGITKIGNRNLFMAYVHIAHDCQIGDDNIFANNASLAGHVHVENHVTFGGFAGVFQFCKVGEHSFITTNSVVIKDIPPYIKVAGHYAKPYGLNTIGLQRKGFTEETLLQLRRAYKIVYRQGLTISKAIEELKKVSVPEITKLIEFITTSEAGIAR